MRRGVIDGQVKIQINYSLEIIGFVFFFCLVVALSVFDDDAVDVNSKTSTTILRAFRTGFVFFFGQKNTKENGKKNEVNKTENSRKYRRYQMENCSTRTGTCSTRFG